MMSGAPPAPKGQISVIGRVGHDCAKATDGKDQRIDAAQASPRHEISMRISVLIVYKDRSHCGCLADQRKSCKRRAGASALFARQFGFRGMARRVRRRAADMAEMNSMAPVRCAPHWLAPPGPP